MINLHIIHALRCHEVDQKVAIYYVTPLIALWLHLGWLAAAYLCR